MCSCLSKSSVISSELPLSLSPELPLSLSPKLIASNLALVPSLIASNPSLDPSLAPALISSNPTLASLISSNPTLAPAITLALLPTIMPSLIPILESKPMLAPALTKALAPLIINAFSIKEDLYSILCDNNGMIEYKSSDMLLLLKCKIDTIKDRFIGNIMSLYMSMIHKQFFYR